jgi:hypothetical protein
MAGSEMPSEHLAAPAAFQANDIIAVNRSTDRDRGCSLFVEFGYRFTKGCERLMHGRNQCSELIGRDLVPANKGGGDLRSQFSIDRCGRHFV